MLPITSLTAAIATLGLIVLSLIVSMGRGKAGVNHGDGGNASLLLRIRAQGNFIEYVPIGLIVIGLCDMAGISATWLWASSLLLLLGRLSHAVGVLSGSLPPRAAGMLMTYVSLLIGTGLLLADYFA
jgi:uncharacterized membrane protein YecN with MAPEG domain